MKFTTRQRFPYPATAQEYGNGAAQMEALATAADAALDRVSAAWTSLRSPSTIVYQLASNLSVPANTLTDFTPPFPTFNVLVNRGSVPSLFPWIIGNSVPAAVLGWWDICVQVASQPSGTVTSGTRRYLAAVKTNQGNRISGDLNQYINEEAEVGSGITYNELNFLLYIDPISFGTSLQFFHSNTGSAVNLLAAGTFLSATKLTGAIS